MLFILTNNKMKEFNFEHGSELYIFLIGENKHENFAIIDRCELTDIWFHVENEPSCHVILKNPNKDKIHDIPREVIRRGLYLCKINSNAKTKKSSIMYTPLKNVTKTNIIGTVIVSNYWTIEM